MKKVLIFSLAYFPKHVGGAEVSIKEITDRIPSSEYEFHMVTNRFDSTLPKEEKIGNVYVHRIGITTENPSMADLKKWPLHLNKFLYQFSAALKADELHNKFRFDGMWAMMAHSCGVPAAIFKMMHPEVGYVLNLQEGDATEKIERTMVPLWPLFKRAFTKADVIQPLSNYLAKWARRMGAACPIEIIPNGADTERFSREYPESEINALKNSLGKRMGDVFLVTTSRLVYKNAVDDVIKSLPRLPENVRFVVMGTGPDEMMLKRLARDAKVEKRIEFLGHIGHDEAPKYLKASDIFIRPSRSEGFGASFAEAMAAGIPVIATQEGGIADFLFDEKRNPDMPVTGFAVDKNSPREIADAVKRIMENPEKARAVAKTAKAMVLEKYNWDVIARDMKTKVLERICASS